MEPELEHVVATFCKFSRSLEHCGEIPGKEHVIGIPPAVDDADTLISFRHICLQLGSERISNLPSTFGRPIAGVQVEGARRCARLREHAHEIGVVFEVGEDKCRTGQLGMHGIEQVVAVLLFGSFPVEFI